MIAIPINLPKIPFHGKIPNGMKIGSLVRIVGQMNHDANRINIDFVCKCQSIHDRDIALHISIRPSEMSIIRNHFENKKWGFEERRGGCLIKPGSFYQIIIIAEKDFYKIVVNGSQLCVFNHRLCLSRVEYISIIGDTSVDSIHFDGDIYSPKKSIFKPIIGGMVDGHIQIKGKMSLHGIRFVINLLCAVKMNLEDDIALHLSLRPDEGVIVRNHYFNRKWGNEEKYGICPIENGANYDISISSDNNIYRIAINGKHFCDFVHRIKPSYVKYISVSGDTEVHSLETNDKNVLSLQ